MQSTTLSGAYMEHLISCSDPSILIPVVPGSSAPNTWVSTDNLTLYQSADHPGIFRYRAAERTHLVHHSFRLASPKDREDHVACSLSRELVDRIRQNTLKPDALYQIRDIVGDPKNHIGHHHG